MMNELQDSLFSLFLTNSNQCENVEEVFLLLSKNSNQEETEENPPSEELNGEILYIAVEVRKREISKKANELKEWFEKNNKFQVLVDIVYVNENGTEVSTLSNKHQLFQDSQFKKHREKIFQRIILKKKKDNEEEQEQEQEQEEEKKIVDHKEEKDCIILQVQNKEDEILKMEEFVFSNNGSKYIIDKIVYLVELPLTIAQKYLKQKLKVKVQLMEQGEEISNTSVSFIKQEYVNDFKKIFEPPTLLLNNLHWSSAFTSDVLYEKKKNQKKRKRKRKKKKINADINTGKLNVDKEMEPEENGGNDGKKEITTVDEQEKRENEDDDNEEEEGEEGEEGEQNIFLDSFDEENVLYSNNDFIFPMKVDLHHIYDKVNKYNEIVYNNECNKESQIINLNKTIIVLNPIHVNYTLLDQYLCLEIENISKNNKIEISELFSRSLRIDHKFPLSLFPEDTYSFFLPILPVVENRYEKNNKQHKKEMKKKTDDDLDCAIVKYEKIIKKYKSENEIRNLGSTSDQTIISLCLKWCIDKSFNNIIWDQYSFEIPLVVSKLFNVEISFVNETSCLSVLVTAFSFYNNHHKDIDLVIELENNFNEFVNSSFISFASSIKVGLIKPKQYKSVNVKLLSTMLGVQSFPFITVKDLISNEVYVIDLGSIIVSK